MLIHLNYGKSRGLSPPPTNGGWVQPASTTAAKQLNPSLVTTLPGIKLVRAQELIAFKVKPLTTLSLAYIGLP